MSAQRVRKLLALAADQDGTPEGEAAARLARRLLEERSAEMAGLDAAERERVDPFERRSILLGGGGHWRCRLLSMVARHCECVAGYKPSAGKGSLYGRQGAVDIAEHLVLVLLRALTVERAHWSMRPELRELPDEELIRRLNDFTGSALGALEVRFEEQLRSERQQAPERFALIRRHSVGLEDWMRRVGFRLGRDLPFPHGHSVDGWVAGYRLPLRAAVRGDDGGA